MKSREAGLVTDQMRATIGNEVDFGPPFEVEKGPIRHLAEVINYPHPLYMDEEYAKSKGYRSIIAPPTFAAYELQRGAPLQALELPFEIGGALHGGDDWEFLQDIQAGDVLTPKGKIIDLSERQGSRGKMLFVTSEVTYRNQNNEIVAIYRPRTVLFPK